MAHMLDILVKNDELATARVVVMGDMNVDTGHKALQAFSDCQTWGSFFSLPFIARSERPAAYPRVLPWRPAGLALDNALDVSPVAKRSSGTFTGWSKRSVGAYSSQLFPPPSSACNLTHTGTTKGITIDHIFVRRHGGDPGARHSVMDVMRYEVGTNIDPKIEGELTTDHRPVTVDVCLRP
jgi:endonuclease/exonuclease/phosphatase family metal-dependent hydrolase